MNEASPAIDTGDTVRHGPTGEQWVVAYVQNGRLAWIGWPEGDAKVEDFTLVEKVSDDYRRKLLEQMAKMPNQDDSRCRYARARLGLDKPASKEGSTMRDRLLAVLRQHWLTGIECNHEARTDVATCFCSKWRSSEQPNVGAAVERWIEHVLEQLPADEVVPPLRRVPSAWIKGFRTPSTPDGPSEYVEECFAGDEPPDNKGGWTPLYREQTETPLQSSTPAVATEPISAPPSTHGSDSAAAGAVVTGPECVCLGMPGCQICGGTGVIPGAR